MDFLFVLNLIIAILLIVVILIQNKGSGLSSVFGGGEIIMERRGAEKFIHKLTTVLAVLFCIISASFLFVNTSNNTSNIQMPQTLSGHPIVEEKSINQNNNNNVNTNSIDNQKIKIETNTTNN